MDTFELIQHMKIKVVHRIQDFHNKLMYNVNSIHIVELILVTKILNYSNSSNFLFHESPF